MKYFRKIFLLLSGIWFLVGIERFSIAYLLPSIAQEFGMSQSRVGAVVSVFAITFGVGVFVIGTLSERTVRGKRVAIVGSTLFAAMFGWLTGMAQSFLQLLAIRGLMGIGEGGTWSPVSSTLSEESPAEGRGGIIGLNTSMLIFGGTVIAPPVVTTLGALFGWRVAFYLIAVPGAVLASLTWFVMRDPPSSMELENSSKSERPSVMEVLSERNVLICSVGTVIFMGWLWVISTFEPFYLQMVHGITGQSMGMIMTGFGLGATIGSIVVGKLTDVYHNRRDVIIGFSTVSGLIGVGHAFLPAGTPQWAIFLTLFAFSFGSGFIPILMIVIPTETVGFERAATAVGITSGLGEILGGGILPIVGGGISDIWGPRATIVFGGFLLVGVGLISVTLRKAKPETEEKPTSQHSAVAAGED